jgi:hypothetical protein
VVTEKSVFNRIAGEAHAGGLELEFAAFLEAVPDAQAHAKNCLAVGIRIDCMATAGGAWIIETKGREELDLPQKMARLEAWRADATATSRRGWAALRLRLRRSTGIRAAPAAEPGCAAQQFPRLPVAKL